MNFVSFYLFDSAFISFGQVALPSMIFSFHSFSSQYFEHIVSLSLCIKFLLRNLIALWGSLVFESVFSCCFQNFIVLFDF